MSTYIFESACDLYVRFETKPSDELRAELKMRGFRWYGWPSKEEDRYVYNRRMPETVGTWCKVNAVRYDADDTPHCDPELLAWLQDVVGAAVCHPTNGGAASIAMADRIAWDGPIYYRTQYPVPVRIGYANPAWETQAVPDEAIEKFSSRRDATRRAA